jgi:hypothetical protein
MVKFQKCHKIWDDHDHPLEFSGVIDVALYVGSFFHANINLPARNGYDDTSSVFADDVIVGWIHYDYFDFNSALTKLRNGVKMRRSCWLHDRHIFIEKFMTKNVVSMQYIKWSEAYYFSLEDIDAIDWMVVNE